MGRLLSDKEIINRNIENFLEKSTSQYTRFLESTPSFVTYYSKNKVRSTSDEGLEDVQSHLGVASPKYYDKIIDLPIYGIDAISLDLVKEDFGMETKYEGSGIVLPHTIKPLPNDYFYIQYIDDIFLFKVNSVVNDKLQGKQFYKIEFSFDRKLDNGDQINLDGQLNREMHVVFEDIGSNNICVIEKEDKFKLEYIKKLQDELITYYSNNYFNTRFNVFDYNIDDKFIYNQYATNFMCKHKLLTREREFLSTISVQDVLPKEKIYNELYRSTIYYALEKNNIDILEGNSIMYMKINNHHTPFYFHKDMYYTLVFTSSNDNVIFDSEFIGRIKDNSPYPEDRKIENLIIEYFNNNDMNVQYSILDKINCIELDYNLYNFVMLPIVLFILKQLENKLINKLAI